MRGLVIKSTGSWYEVKEEETDKMYACRIRGKLRLDGIKTTNPVAVGDWVNFEPEDEPHQGVINNVEERDNYIIRKSIKNKNQAHIIASNIDQCVIIATLQLPKTSLGFIDRLLITAEAYHIPQIIVFNKVDLLSKEDEDELDEIIGQYKKLGVECQKISAQEGIGLNDFISLLFGKKSLFSGHSGVGKSTLLNILTPDLALKTNEISDFAKKGVHTTTFAEMFTLDDDTHIIDTPGIKELGLMDIDPEELSNYFPEMRAIKDQCKFHNCLHLNEPKCAVKDAVDNNDIASSRYKSYLSMLENDDNRR